MTNKYILSISVVILIIFSGFLYYLNTSSKVLYLSVSATTGTIVQKVLATGNVESPTTNNLSFETVGKLIKLNIKTGEHVERGDILAQQDSSILDTMLIQAKANVTTASTALLKLKEGATIQTIAFTKTKLTTAKRSLDNSYSSVRNTLISAQTKAIDATTNQLADFFYDAQTNNPRLTFTISDFTLANNILSGRVAATEHLYLWQKEISSISANTTKQEYNTALSNAAKHLDILHTLLKDSVSAVAVNSGLPATTEASYRTMSSVGLSEINAASTQIQTLQHIISIKNTTIASAQANLKLITAAPTKNSVDEQKSRIKSLEAQVKNIEVRIRNLEIIAPVSGIVTNTNGTVGDVLSPNITVVSLLSDAKLQVNANISEDNIVGISVGDPVSIKLDAFPLGTKFLGVISEIDPAQTIIRGAVYYKTTIIFDKDYKDIRSGMTANVQITTASSSDAIIIPASAITTTATSSSVRILENRKPVVRIVKTAITGQNGMVQIISGISNGEKVITGEK